ncbi:MAG: NAD(P)H-dependent glycerol-3-phosphate dehydrogenase, partial [Gammaproteobacteria bacterium]
MAADAVLVLGAGSWGTALGLVLARKGARTYLWDCDRAHIDRLLQSRSNERHLPGISFPESLIPVHDLDAVSTRVHDVVVAVPCENLRDALMRLRSAALQGMRFCVASKGMEPGTFALNHQVAADCLGDPPLAVLSGPSFAREVAEGLPTAVTIASE